MESSSTEILFQPTPVAERQEASEWAGVAVELLGFFEKNNGSVDRLFPTQFGYLQLLMRGPPRMEQNHRAALQTNTEA